MPERKRIALLSVFDKTGIVEFAQALLKLDFTLVASGGTCRKLKEAGLEVIDVAKFTGLPPIMDHRVVTLDPSIHAGLLAEEKHRPELEKHGFPWIDLVYCNLYPLQDEIAKDEATLESVIDKTDIGGPTMLRSAAKGRRIVIVDPDDCAKVLHRLREKTEDDEKFISDLVAKAEATIADYCLASARYHSDGEYEGFIGKKTGRVAYAENRQDGDADLFAELGAGKDDPFSFVHFKGVEGADPGYINVTDFDRALKTLVRICATYDVNKLLFDVAVGVKHGNPCGAAVGENSLDVIKKMIEGDYEAIFGGIIAVNFAITHEEAELLRTWKMDEGQKRVLDGIMAPFITPDAVEILKRKNGACKMYTNSSLMKEALTNLSVSTLQSGKMFRQVRGGFLTQKHPGFILNMKDEQLKKTREADLASRVGMILAQCIAWTSNSNNISLVRYDTESLTMYLIANGNNQTSRIGALELANFKAERMGHKVRGSYMASDSFCPFTDVPQRAGELGIHCAFVPEKGVRAKEVFAEFEKQRIIVYSLPDDVCRGFCEH